jgi:peptide chain release factor 2
LHSINSKKKWTDEFQAAEASVEDAAVMHDFFQAGDATDAELKEQYEITLKKVEELEFKNMLSSEEDQLNAVMQITAGAGGTESQDWVSMLARMYTMWGEKSGYKVNQIDILPGDEAGIK